jgi:hypothetical protein
MYSREPDERGVADGGGDVFIDIHRRRRLDTPRVRFMVVFFGSLLVIEVSAALRC